MVPFDYGQLLAHSFAVNQVLLAVGADRLVKGELKWQRTAPTGHHQLAKPALDRFRLVSFLVFAWLGLKFDVHLHELFVQINQLSRI